MRRVASVPGYRGARTCPPDTVDRGTTVMVVLPAGVRRICRSLRFFSCRCVLAGLIAFCATLPLGAKADVLVLSNRTPQAVRLTVGSRTAWWTSYRLRPSETIAVYVAPTELRVMLHEAAPQSGEAVFECVPDRAYFVYREDDGRLQLAAIGLAGSSEPLLELRALLRPLATLSPTTPPPLMPLRLRVRVAVDDEERAKTIVWQRRLRKRLQLASATLGRQLGVQLELLDMTTWDSDDAVEDFEFALAEFSWEVPAEPADVAIGFTSQFALVPPQDGHLGSSHGPLQRHILIREASPGLTPMDYVELVVHELGHFLGAAHSPEPESVMRPRLGDQKAVVRRFIIQLDPLNALAAATVVEQLRMRRQPPRSLGDLPLDRRYFLARIYATLEKALPDDTTASRYLSLVQPPLRTAPTGFAARIRQVVLAVVAEAERVHTDPNADLVNGDVLTARYVRAAARAALQSAEDDRAKAFLIGLAIALDREQVFAKTPWLSTIYKAVESPAERTHRLRVLGRPTVHGREDLLAHFSVSAALHALVGRALAWEAGLMKELQDANSGSGFSFADLAADLAGLKFAGRALVDEAFLANVAESFEVADYVPSPEGLQEGLSIELFRRRYGGRRDERFQAAVDALQALIDQLPGY